MLSPPLSLRAGMLTTGDWNATIRSSCVGHRLLIPKDKGRLLRRREQRRSLQLRMQKRPDSPLLRPGLHRIEWSQQEGCGCFCWRDVERSSSPRRHENSIPSCSVRVRANPAAWLPPQGAQDELPGPSCAGWRFLGPSCLHRDQQRDLILIWTLLQLWWLPFLSLHFLQKGLMAWNLNSVSHTLGSFTLAYRSIPRHSVCSYLYVYMWTAICCMRIFQTKMDPTHGSQPWRLTRG